MKEYFLLESKLCGKLGIFFIGNQNKEETLLKILRCIRYHDDELNFKAVSEEEFMALQMTNYVNNRTPVKLHRLQDLIVDYIYWIDKDQKQTTWRINPVSWGPGPEQCIDKKRVEKILKQLTDYELTKDELVTLNWKNNQTVENMMEKTIPEIIKNLESKNNINR